MDDNLSYDLYVNKHRRDINCLIDQDRNTRKMSLDKLTKDIFLVNSVEYITEITREYLLVNVLRCLDDKIEKIRETAIKMIFKILENANMDDKMNNLILTSVISRLNTIPFPETCNKYFNL